MKRFLILTIFLLAGILPSRVLALTINQFNADITIQKDSSIAVTETVQVNFDEALHGIYRDIPFAYTGTDGKKYYIPIENISVTDGAGNSVQTKITKTSDSFHIRIGDPAKTLTGPADYIITYQARGAINFFADHDELYWNITGSSWEVPFADVSATIHTPGGSASTIQKQCFSGDYGSTASDCTSAVAGSDVTFTAKDFLTVVVGFPTGFVTKPADYDTVRSVAPNIRTVPYNAMFWFIQSVFNGILPIAGAILLYWWWYKHGRDPGKKRTVIAQYDPPDGLRPAEMQVVKTENTDKASISATIIDLAVRGYIRIRETETPRVLGLGSKKDYELILLKSYAQDAALKKYEQRLLEGIFGTMEVETLSVEKAQSEKRKLRQLMKNRGKIPIQPEQRKIVKISSLKNTFSGAVVLIRSSLFRQVSHDGYFVGNPDTVRKVYYFVGFALVALTVFPAQYLYETFGQIIAGPAILGVLILLAAHTLPKRTPKGVEAAWQAHGFKLFLEKAEKYRIQWQERENIFETFLPYAMVFGVAEKWSKALADVAGAQPSWYEGQPGMAWNNVVLWSAISSFQSTANSAFISTAASGGSGFGGGGFSGGGGGGGGGGGW